MANSNVNHSVNQSDMLGRIIRAVVLIVVSIILSIIAVSFAVHHMRLLYEDEFRSVSDRKVEQVCDVVKMTLDGNDISADPSGAAVKYSNVFELMLSDTTTETLSTESYGLFVYTDGQLSLLFSQGVSDPTEFAVAGRDISEWLKGDFSKTKVRTDSYESIILPITDNTGMCVAVFEYKVTFPGLFELGNSLEGRILTSVVISLVAGIILFVLQELFVKFMRGKQGGNSHTSETKKSKEKRLISSTIGYCFAIVLVVLFVMSSNLSSVYLAALESERADAMEKAVLTSATALNYTEIKEGMDYNLPSYSYDSDKKYLVDIFTMAGDSFLRLYSSSDTNNIEQYYLSNAGKQYINCFQNQEIAFTKRSDDGVSYVCAIAPIISQEKTVAGIIEYRMPVADFEATVNGMSLSWIFTIISIAISMGIIIFELNLLISTMTKGVSGNMPVLIMYGENANRFLSFFLSFGSIMVPVIISSYFKDELASYDNPMLVNILTGVTTILFALGFFGFSALRRIVKSKLTSRIALIAVTVFGYFLALLCGIVNNPFLFIAMTLPIGICFGMPLDYLRDYRINAGKLGYKGFDDRTIHNLQATQYMLGISVGTVVSGMVYERFGLLIVSIISGFSLLITVICMITFMQNNTVVRESYLSINKLVELLSDKYTGRFLKSSFFVLGVAISFMLVFVPNYLERVGISTATASFYYLLCAFMACFVTAIIKSHYNVILTSKIRVIIQASITVIGLLAFAVLPSAKMLVVTVALLGIAFGIHDFYYLYVLFLLANNRFKTNLRRAAEQTLILGIVSAVPVFAVAFILSEIRIVFLICVFILALLAFIYPMSSYSNDVDDRDPNLAKKKAKVAQPVPQPQQVEEAPVSQGYDYSNPVVNQQNDMYQNSVVEDPLAFMDNQPPIEYETQDVFTEQTQEYVNQDSYYQNPVNPEDNGFGGDYNG